MSPDNLYHESHHTLQYSSNTHHDKPSKDFYHSQNEEFERIPSPQTGQFLVHYSQHKQEQPENVDNLHESHEACGQNFQSLHKSGIFLNELSSVEIKEDISL